MARSLGGCLQCIVLLSCIDAAKQPSRFIPAAAPLLPVGPVNQENNKGKSIDSVAILSTVLVEPTYLYLISNATFSDADMKKFVKLAQGLSPKFRISTVVVS